MLGMKIWTALNRRLSSLTAMSIEDDCARTRTITRKAAAPTWARRRAGVIPLEITSGAMIR